MPPAFIGFFYLLTFILGFGAMVIVGQPAIRAIDAGGNMAAPLLAQGGRRRSRSWGSSPPSPLPPFWRSSPG